jgi:hypothetical protein
MPHWGTGKGGVEFRSGQHFRPAMRDRNGVRRPSDGGDANSARTWPTIFLSAETEELRGVRDSMGRP